MYKGVSIFETYEGPQVEAIEFSLHDGNFDSRAEIARKLRPQVKSLSAHLPSFLPVQDVGKNLAFDDGLVDYFVAHVTKKSADLDWASSWEQYASHGKKIYFENHNQGWHPTDAGMTKCYEFIPLVKAGHKLCLDLGHILYASMFRPDGSWVSDHQEWLDIAEFDFRGFLGLPIGAVHVHTVDHFKGTDHQLNGFNIGPWLREIVKANPDVSLLVEVMDPKYTVQDRLSTLKKWLRPDFPDPALEELEDKIEALQSEIHGLKKANDRMYSGGMLAIGHINQALDRTPDNGDLWAIGDALIAAFERPKEDHLVELAKILDCVGARPYLHSMDCSMWTGPLPRKCNKNCKPAKPEVLSPLLCNHANEVRKNCKCSSDCYCRIAGSCS